MRLYFNPDCSKSRVARALLEDCGHDPEVIDYRATPLDEAALGGLIDALDGSPASLVRAHDAKSANEPIPTDRADVIALLARHPARLQRPILEHDGRAVIARPPERVFELVDPTHA